MKKILSLLVLFFAFVNMAFAAVNLNTATKDELDAVKGIGPVKAQAIIDYRTQNGSFKSVDDLKNVKGFGDKSVEKMRSELSVSGGASASKKEAKADKKEAAKEDKKAAKEPVAKDSAKADKKAAKEAKKAEKEAKKEAKKAEKAEKAAKPAEKK